MLITLGMWINNMGGEGVMEQVFGTAGDQGLAQRKAGINRSTMWKTKPGREVIVNQIGAEGVLARQNLMIAAGDLERAASDLENGVAVSVETINGALLAACGALTKSSSLPPQPQAQNHFPGQLSASGKP